jgi:hypothetical protein
MLMAGLQIAFGGALTGDFSRSANNFTTNLFDLLESYAGLAQQAGADGLKPIANYAPWPLRLGYGGREYQLFGSAAVLIEEPEPAASEVPENPEELFPEPATAGGFASISVAGSWSLSSIQEIRIVTRLSRRATHDNIMSVTQPCRAVCKSAKRPFARQCAYLLDRSVL